MAKTRVGYEIEDSILTAFKDKIHIDDLKANQVVSAALRSYSEGILKFDSGRLVPIGTSIKDKAVTTPKKATIEEPKVEKSKILFAHPSETKEQLKLRELPEFDYPDDLHRDVDPRERMEMDKEYEEGQGTLEQMIDGEYIPHRDLFREGQWIDEFWNFARYCAKKLIRMSGNPRLRYDEDYLHDKLWAVREVCEEDYLIQKANYENSK